MPPYQIGDVNDRVTLELGTATVANAESYRVNVGIFQQPASFSLSLGTRNNAAEILKATPPRTPFRLRIGGALQQTGLVDEPGSDGNELGGTVVTVTGRDMMAPIHDGFMVAEKSFNGATYLDLAAYVRDQFGLKGEIVPNNENNRKIMTGSKSVHSYKQPETVEEILQDVGTDGVVYRTITAKLGDRGYSFLKRHLDREGLFFWAAAENYYVLSSPNVNQAPLWKIIRYRGQLSSETAIVGHSYRNGSQPPRYTEARVYARAGGRKAGRGQLKGLFEDQEMIDWGFVRPLVIRDAKSTTAEQAAYLARRKLAEGRRSVRHFQYTLAGHSWPTFVNGASTGPRAVWSPDTMVAVYDEEIGVYGNFWLESVEHQRSQSGTTSTIKLLPPGDLFFGSDDP